MTSQVYRLFSEDFRHPKIDKNLSVGVLGKILHLAPANRSGYEVCPMRSAGCTAACLNTAGFQYARKENARINRTKLFFEDRPRFMDMLIREISSARRRAEKLGMDILSVRLNGTSDIPWERVRVPGAQNVMELFPDVAFMDYTKRPNRRDLPHNYRLVFSRSESNEEACAQALDSGMNVAAVFRTHKNDPLPAWWSVAGVTLPVIDGDLHDFRYQDYEEHRHRVIVGLRAKGRAVRDLSGFVIDPCGQQRMARAA